MSSPDPIRQLQAAARAVTEYVMSGRNATRVVVFDETGARVIDVAVPASGPTTEDEARVVPAAVPSAGWVVTERNAVFDGKPVAVAPSRLRLLRVLVEAEGAMTAKELTAAAFDRTTDEANTRYHIRELKKELKAAFTFEGDVVQGDGEGYRLILR